MSVKNNMNTTIITNLKVHFYDNPKRTGVIIGKSLKYENIVIVEWDNSSPDRKGITDENEDDLVIIA